MKKLVLGLNLLFIFIIVFDLFIDDPEKDTITLETFRRICKDVGDNVSDEELRNILEITTQSGNDISFDDFCQYMKLTA